MAKITAHHYVLAVPDAQKSADFYVQKLGFKLLPNNADGWRFISRDKLMIMLGSCPDAIHPQKLGDHSYFAYFVVDQVDEYYKEITSKGVETLSPPSDKPWGMREFGIRTLDGHRIMIGESIS